MKEKLGEKRALTVHRAATGPAAHGILVIDDDLNIRHCLKEVLESEGYEVFTAGDGEQGIELMRRSPLPLVLTDLLMPVMEGIETIRAIRKEWPATKIIALSGGARITNGSLLNMAGRLGADATMEKPFDPDELIDLIKRLMSPPAA